VGSVTAGSDPTPPPDDPVLLVPLGVLPPKPNDAPVEAVEPVEPDTEVLAPPDADTAPDGEDPPDVEPPDNEPPDDVPVGEPEELDDPVVDGEDPDDEDPAVDEDELDELEPPEPPEPLGSAKATTGTDAIAAPTPNATASAPTRPMYRA
jgi:hypothetical protein